MRRNITKEMRRKPIIALIYDFDGTLSPGNMQEFGFIQAVGQTPEEFWTKSDNIARGQDASNILAYMKLMFDEAKKNGIPLRRKEFTCSLSSMEIKITPRSERRCLAMRSRLFIKESHLLWR